MGTSARKTKQSTLPRIEDQAMKFHHLRYKVFPICELEIDENDFFKQIGFPVQEVYSSQEQNFTNAGVVPHGGMTVAYKINTEENAARVGICKCSLQDLYKKDLGRVISSGRYTKAEATPDNFHLGVVYVNLLDENFNGMTPTSVLIRSRIVEEVNGGDMKPIENDLAAIRSYVAGKTKYPFYVELS